MNASKGSLKARKLNLAERLKENEKVLAEARTLAERLVSISGADWNERAFMARKEIMEAAQKLPYQGRKEFRRVHQTLFLERYIASSPDKRLSFVWVPAEPGIRDEWSGPLPKWDSPEFPEKLPEGSLVKDQSYPIYRGQWMVWKFVGFDLVTLGGETVAVQGFGPKGTPETITHQGRLTYCQVR